MEWLTLTLMCRMDPSKFSKNGICYKGFVCKVRTKFVCGEIWAKIFFFVDQLFKMYTILVKEKFEYFKVRSLLYCRLFRNIEVLSTVQDVPNTYISSFFQECGFFYERGTDAFRFFLQHWDNFFSQGYLRIVFFGVGLTKKTPKIFLPYQPYLSKIDQIKKEKKNSNY